MAWIRVVTESEADDELLKVYQQVKGSRGKLSNILSVHSLNPPALQAHMDLYMGIMFGPSGLSREEREMIAVVVSSADRCPYCIQHHAAALSHYWKDEPHAMVEADVQGLRDCDLADEDVLTINLITSYFNFVNRIALGLGVAFSPEEVEGYKY